MIISVLSRFEQFFALSTWLFLVIFSLQDFLLLWFHQRMFQYWLFSLSPFLWTHSRLINILKHQEWYPNEINDKHSSFSGQRDEVFKGEICRDLTLNWTLRIIYIAHYNLVFDTQNFRLERIVRKRLLWCIWAYKSDF